jgi:hypothetical protein
MRNEVKNEIDKIGFNTSLSFHLSLQIFVSKESPEGSCNDQLGNFICCNREI